MKSISQKERENRGGLQKSGGRSAGTVSYTHLYNHRPTVVSGVMEEACAAILRDFFRALREKRRRLRFQEKSDVADV